MHCLYGGYNLHRSSDALGLVSNWFCFQTVTFLMKELRNSSRHMNVYEISTDVISSHQKLKQL